VWERIKFDGLREYNENQANVGDAVRSAWVQVVGLTPISNV